MNGAISWFAKNHVASNLLMAVIIAAGTMSLVNLKQEVFPEIASEVITVTVPYLGAAPEEVEEGVCQRIEERIQDLEGIKEVRSTAAEGTGVVSIELLPGQDPRESLDDIKARVDAIDTFPEETEKPIVQELTIRRQVINLAISGQAPEATLKSLAERVRDDLLTLPEVTQVDLGAVRPYEISIEVSERQLRQYGLTFDQVAQAVKRSSLDLPGGSIRTEGAEILLRAKGQAYRGGDFEDLTLLTRPDGTHLRLGDVATVVDGFAQTDQSSRFDGQPTALVQVFRVGDQGAIEVANAVEGYLERARSEMPAGITITTWQDDTKVLRSRLDLMLRNGRAGLVLVFFVLALFLKLRLAGWVALGIPISFLGAFWLMPVLDVSINLISLFAFIVVLGIVVDDAIVVGENIYRHLEKGKAPLRAAIDGAREVAMPVTFSVLTTMAAFAPLIFVAGRTGKVMRFIPIIVIATLVFSLIESLFVLPAHLGHSRAPAKRPPKGIFGAWSRLQRAFNERLQTFIKGPYQKSLRWFLRWRYSAMAASFALLLITAGLVAGGRVRFTFFPPVEADSVVAFLTLPQGTPAEVTEGVIRNIEEKALELGRQLDSEGEPGAFRHVLSSIGEQPYRADQSRAGGGAGGSVSAAHLGEVNIELAPAEERTITSPEIANRWREMVGEIPDASELVFTSSLFSTGDPINVQFAGPDLASLEAAADRLKQSLKDYPGVFDIADSFQPGKREFQLQVTPEAEALGVTLGDLGRQVRQAFFGEEAQRVLRGRDEVRVMVRYTEEERRSIGSLEDMRIRTATGGEVPFSVAGQVKEGRGFATIQRVNRQRTVNVTADVDTVKANANQIIADLNARVLPGIKEEFPRVRATFEGEQQEQRDTMQGLVRGLLMALLVIYGLLAIPFKSYLQPGIVMAAIPFGLIGAIWGHLALGMDLTMLSAFGIVALTGVVVNDSLVMVDFINRAVREGLSIPEALQQAGSQRFRPIVLTSLTTFVGLLPLLLERSLQAQFLIPMAVSLAFGVLFATVITLFLVPACYAILEDLKALLLQSPKPVPQEGVG